MAGWPDGALAIGAKEVRVSPCLVCRTPPQLPVYGKSADTEQFGGPGFIAAAHLQSFLQGKFCFQGRGLWVLGNYSAAVLLGIKQTLGQIMHGNDVRFTENAGVFHGVLQFAHVTWPGVAIQDISHIA